MNCYGAHWCWLRLVIFAIPECLCVLLGGTDWLVVSSACGALSLGNSSPVHVHVHVFTNCLAGGEWVRTAHQNAKSHEICQSSDHLGYLWAAICLQHWFNRATFECFEDFMTLLTVHSFVHLLVLFCFVCKVPLKWYPISRLIWFLQCLSAAAYRLPHSFVLPMPRFLFLIFCFVAFYYLRTFFIHSHTHFLRKNEFYAFPARSWVTTVSWVWHTWANRNDDAEISCK